MDALTYIPRLILGFYGRMLEYAVDISLTAVGLAENITLSCIGAVMGGVQGSYFLMLSILREVTNPSSARLRAEQQLLGFQEMLPSIPGLGPVRLYRRRPKRALQERQAGDSQAGTLHGTTLANGVASLVPEPVESGKPGTGSPQQWPQPQFAPYTPERGEMATPPIHAYGEHYAGQEVEQFGTEMQGTEEPRWLPPSSLAGSTPSAKRGLEGRLAEGEGGMHAFGSGWDGDRAPGGPQGYPGAAQERPPSASSSVAHVVSASVGAVAGLTLGVGAALGLAPGEQTPRGGVGAGEAGGEGAPNAEIQAAMERARVLRQKTARLLQEGEGMGGEAAGDAGLPVPDGELVRPPVTVQRLGADPAVHGLGAEVEGDKGGMAAPAVEEGEVLEVDSGEGEPAVREAAEEAKDAEGQEVAPVEVEVIEGDDVGVVHAVLPPMVQDQGVHGAAVPAGLAHSDLAVESPEAVQQAKHIRDEHAEEIEAEQAKAVGVPLPAELPQQEEEEAESSAGIAIATPVNRAVTAPPGQGLTPQGSALEESGDFKADSVEDSAALASEEISADTAKPEAASPKGSSSADPSISLPTPTKPANPATRSVSEPPPTSLPPKAKKKRGPIRGPLHKMGKELKSLFT